MFRYRTKIAAVRSAHALSTVLNNSPVSDPICGSGGTKNRPVLGRHNHHRKKIAQAERRICYGNDCRAIEEIDACWLNCRLS